jgi:hypothetical protein
VGEFDRDLTAGGALRRDEHDGVIGSSGDGIELVPRSERGRIVGVHAA